MTRPTRRRFLRSAAVLGAGLCSGPNGLMAGSAQASLIGADAFGALQPPDPQGLMLPPEFSARVVAVAERKPIPSAATAWHRAPDGGATFARPDGGWVYVSNSERSLGRGGARALAFNAEGEIIVHRWQADRDAAQGAPVPQAGFLRIAPKLWPIIIVKSHRLSGRTNFAKQSE